MPGKIYDRLLLSISLIIISPLIIAALISIAVGYPVHLMKGYILYKMRKSKA